MEVLDSGDDDKYSGDVCDDIYDDLLSEMSKDFDDTKADDMVNDHDSFKESSILQATIHVQGNENSSKPPPQVELKSHPSTLMNLFLGDNET